MLLRRIFQHLKDQNWIAVVLDLLVVFVGILLAFQVDRWYENRLFKSREQGFLISLAEDMVGTVAEFERALNRLEGTAHAATALLRLTPSDADNLSHTEFYGLLGIAARLTAINTVSRTYDALVASGDIEALSNTELRQQLAAFYSRVRAFDLGNLDDQVSLKQNQFDPFVSRELDQVALMHAQHPEATAEMTSSRPADQFRQVIGREDFEAVIATKWHAAYDLYRAAEFSLEQAKKIEQILKENLEDRYPEGASMPLREE